ncbi:MAG: preprotein translocase subunit YajC [Nitrosomonadales bacterium]|nr:preprotein translocase subunit YajC [Nitrosomonadales bacterium]MBT3917897.1 preprotein translocase subunit YajC [Nitrosomonadales bacterium]MBT4183206.1 preprotein translocase subunit YajC [Nitrosomonadales bacterium]MBT4571527.1 preprotein translocase subunit YajC [Nitrosomonadales bacterium]MBT4759101.1 preprotein translocase subunit YajC [Nitrosomonadales bacterium]
MNEALSGFLPFIIIFVLFYFMLIRPQMAQAKKVKAMLEALKVGDEVSTSGGILGKITKLNDQFAIIEVNANSEIKIQKQTIQALLPKGTIKSI